MVGRSERQCLGWVGAVRPAAGTAQVEKEGATQRLAGAPSAGQRGLQRLDRVAGGMTASVCVHVARAVGPGSVRRELLLLATMDNWTYPPRWPGDQPGTGMRASLLSLGRLRQQIRYRAALGGSHVRGDGVA